MNLKHNPEKLAELKIRLKKKFPKLTEADLNTPEGEVNDMYRMLEYKLRKSKQELKEIIERL
jgi:hypothetical protein